VTCPPSVEGYVTVYNNFGTWYDLYFYSQIGGDYEVEFFIDGISAGTQAGYVNGNAEPIQVNVSAEWDDNASHQLNITFSPYELPDLICGDYSTTVDGVGSFNGNFLLMGGIHLLDLQNLKNLENLVDLQNQHLNEIIDFYIYKIERSECHVKLLFYESRECIGLSG
jgi:hypothetical protein